MLAAPASLVGSSLAGSDGAPPSAVAAAAPAAAVLATPASLVGSSLAGSDAVSATPAPGSAISYVSHGGTILSSSHVSTDSCGRLAPAAAARASHARSLEAMTCAVAELARAPLDASPPVGRDDAQTGAAPAARAGTARVPTDLQPVPTTPFTGGAGNVPTLLSTSCRRISAATVHADCSPLLDRPRPESPQLRYASRQPRVLDDCASQIGSSRQHVSSRPLPTPHRLSTPSPRLRLALLPRPRLAQLASPRPPSARLVVFLVWTRGWTWVRQTPPNSAKLRRKSRLRIR